MTYTPEQGDIVYVDFDPQSGREQRGRRPALVVSNSYYHEYTNLALVCPITNTISGFPIHILLDKSTKTTGEIMCEQVKSLDYTARNAQYIEKAPSQITDKAINYISSFI